MKRKIFKDCILYLLLDKEVAGDKIFKIAKDIAKSKIDIIQFRDKNSSDKDFLVSANRLRNICKNKIFIINDRADIAKLVDADGLHLGQDDPAPKYIRRLIGKNKIIGISCHNLAQIKKSRKQDLDYISVGPIFKTALKPNTKSVGIDLITKAKKYSNKPFFAIGGINLKNLDSLKAVGIKRIAACQLFSSYKNIEKRIKIITNKLR